MNEEGQISACGFHQAQHIPPPMASARTIARYSAEALAVLIPLGAVIYFLFDPDAFNASLAWLMRL